MPAWLLRSLEDPDGSTIASTIYHLSPSPESMAESKTYFEERFSIFNREQRKAITYFLLDVEDYQLWVGTGGEIERAKALWSPDS